MTRLAEAARRAGREGPSRGLWLAWAALRLFGVVALNGGFPYNRTISSNGDVVIYYVWSGYLWHGQIPYRDFPLFYPPGIVPILGLPPASYHVYRAEFLIVVLLIDALVFWALHRSNRPVGAVVWMVGAPLLGPIFWARLDIFVAGALVAAVLATESGRHRWAGFWIAVAALFKLWPVVLLLLLLSVIPRDRWRRFLGSAGATLALGVLPFMDAGGTRNLARVAQFQAGRGIEIESVFAVPLYILRSLGHSVPIARHAAMEFTGSLGALVADLSGVAFAVILVALLAMASRRRAPHLDASGWLLLLVAAVILTSKVLSPQFLVVVVAAVGLAIDRVERGKVFLLVSLGFLLLSTQAQFPFGFRQLVEASPAALPLSAVHAATVVVFAIASYRAVAVRDAPSIGSTHDSPTGSGAPATLGSD
jgi:hypothetical protein